MLKEEFDDESYSCCLVIISVINFMTTISFETNSVFY